MAFSREVAMGAGLGVVALAAIIAGLSVTGGPGEARRLKQDQLREEALASTANALVCLQKAGVEIPEAPDALEAAWAQHLLSAENTCFNARVSADPVTDEPFLLKRREGRVAEICASFATGREQDVPPDYRATNALPGLGDTRENGGEHCFAINYAADVG